MALGFSDVELLVVPETEEDRAALKNRRRSFEDLAKEIIVLAQGTNTYGWEQGGAEIDVSKEATGEGIVNVGAKPISPRQWLDAMAVATGLATGRRAIGELGPPLPGAHPEGFPMLIWRESDARFFVLQLRPGASLISRRNFRLCWERLDARGKHVAESTTIEDVAGALLSTFGKGA